MAIKAVSYYLAEPYRPTYYIMLYEGTRSRTERPSRPTMIYRSDTWPEAKRFAEVYVSMHPGFWMGVSSLSPKRQDQGAVEVAHVDYWNENNQLMREESRLPSEVVRSMSEAITNEPIAREADDSEGRKRMKEVIRLMKNAKPGDTLTDILGRKYEAERAAKMRESMERLKEEAIRKEKTTGRPKQYGLDEFKEAHEKEPTLSDPRGFFPFRNWVINHKLPEADSMLLGEALDEAKTAGKDLTYDEAKDKVKQSLETSDKPWSVISQAIDWNTITLEEEQRHQVSEAAEIVKAALEAGIIQAKDVGLYRKNPAGMSVEEKRAFQKQIEDLERQLQEARKPPPSQYGTGKPSIRSAPLNYTQDQIDLLYNYFQNQLERSLKRSPSAPELNRFDEFINRIQRVKPAIKFDRLKGQVEDIAMALAALARGASIPRKTEAQRIRELLEKMLTSELTPEEEEEISKLEGRIEDAEHMPLGLMEPDRPRPNIRIIAESGPEKFLLGRPLAMDQPGPYPRELMRTWEMSNAQVNKENFEKKGYVIRIEEF